MKNKTIYLQRNPFLFSLSFFIMGTLFCIMFFVKYYSAAFELFDLIYLVVGCFELFFSVTFFPRFHYVPKVSLDQQKVFVKPDIWKKSYIVKWKDVTRIRISSYYIEFYLKNGKTKQLNIPYLKDLSLEIKNAVREASEYQNIEIVRM